VQMGSQRCTVHLASAVSACVTRTMIRSSCVTSAIRAITSTASVLLKERCLRSIGTATSARSGGKRRRGY
jgi:hypothetical protein